MGITKTSSGRASLFTLDNGQGVSVTVTDIGAAVVSFVVSGKDGKKRDIVLGFDSAEEYFANKPYFGVVVGRFGNRIRGGCFSLDGKQYQLDKNDGGKHHLHGGCVGIGSRKWEAETDGGGVVMRYLSPEGEGGYPGDAEFTVRYSLTSRNGLLIEYTVTTSAKTIANPTNHSYFNLNGCESGTILNHELTIFADEFLETDGDLIPTGKIIPAAGTALDFTSPKPIGKDICSGYIPVVYAGGFDHCYILRNGNSRHAAHAYSPESGLALDIYTDNPAIQFYSGNFLDGTVTGKHGIPAVRNSGFCLETQFYPDAVNHAHFPSCVLTRDKPMRFSTEYVVSAN